MQPASPLTRQHLEAIIGQFQLAGSLRDYEPLSGGLINLSVAVTMESAQGRLSTWLLQRLNRHVFSRPEALMDNIRLVGRHLLKRGYPMQVLEPVPARNGQWLHLDEQGHPWRLFPYFERTRSWQSLPSEELARSVAHAFGIFAACLSDLPPQQLNLTIPNFHDGSLRRRQLLAAVKKAAPARLEAASALLGRLEEWLPLLDAVEALPMPLRIAHHDAKVANVLFDESGQQPVAIVDWDTTMPGRWISDFGDLVRTAAASADENETDLSRVHFLPRHYEALLDGYAEATWSCMADIERRHLPTAGPWLTLMQAVRFLTDFLHGDRYYPVTYVRQNLDRALNQWTLFDQMKHLARVEW